MGAPGRLAAVLPVLGESMPLEVLAADAVAIEPVEVTHRSILLVVLGVGGRACEQRQGSQ